MAAETEKCVPVMSSASMPPVHATGMSMSTMTVSTQLLTARVDEEADEQERQGDDEHQARLVSLSSLISPSHSRWVL